MEMERDGRKGRTIFLKQGNSNFMGGKIMRTWCIDFENEELGISVDAKTKERAVEIAENPCN